MMSGEFLNLQWTLLLLAWVIFMLLTIPFWTYYRKRNVPAVVLTSAVITCYILFIVATMFVILFFP